MLWVNSGSGFRNVKDVLIGEYLKVMVCRRFPLYKFFASFQHQHGTSVPSNTYNRWGWRSIGCGGGNTTSSTFSMLLMVLETVAWKVSKILAGVCYRRFSCR